MNGKRQLLILLAAAFAYQALPSIAQNSVITGNTNINNSSGTFELPMNRFRLLTITANSRSEVLISWVRTTPDNQQLREVGKFMLEIDPSLQGHMAMLMLLRQAQADDSLRITIGIDSTTSNQPIKTVTSVGLRR